MTPTPIEPIDCDLLERQLASEDDEEREPFDDDDEELVTSDDELADDELPPDDEEAELAVARWAFHQLQGMYREPKPGGLN